MCGRLSDDAVRGDVKGGGLVVAWVGCVHGCPMQAVYVCVCVRVGLCDDAAHGDVRVGGLVVAWVGCVYECPMQAVCVYVCVCVRKAV